jgi:hypothetical protein
MHLWCESLRFDQHALQVLPTVSRTIFGPAKDKALRANDFETRRRS